jgi:hypothetical protein
MEASTRIRAKHGLALLTLVSFIASFLVARIFTTISPGATVIAGGIHLHHFWYGLVMVVVSGWLSIVLDRPELERILAIVFGLGAGLIGDETGLLLTLGDYQSELTYVIFVGVISFAGIGFLLLRYRDQLRRDVLSIGRGEKILQLGVFGAGVSVLAFAFNQWGIALAILSLGVLAVLIGLVVHRGEISNAHFSG